MSTFVRRITLGVMSVALLMLTGLTDAPTSQPAEADPTVTRAEAFAALLAAEQYDQAVAQFDDQMTEALPADKLQAAWEGMIGELGPFQKVLGTRLEQVGEFTVALVTCSFEKGSFDIKIVYNDADKISGLWFVPTPQEVLDRYQDDPGESAAD